MKSRLLVIAVFAALILVLFSGSGSAESSPESPPISVDGQTDWDIDSSNWGNVLAGVQASPIDWNWDVSVVDETSADVGEWPSIEIDSNGEPRISYSDTFNSRLRFARLVGNTWVHTVPDSTSGAGKFSDLILDDFDNAHIAYVNELDDDLLYIRIPAGGDPEPSEVVNSYTEVDNYPAIALEADGDPIFAYQVTRNLAFASRGPHYPPWYTLETIHYQPSRDVGRWPSMKMDANGYPHISYYDRTYGALMYISKDENGWRDDEFVDNQDSAGSYTSLALDSKGLPHISYLTYRQAAGCHWTSYRYTLKYAYKDNFGIWHTEVVDDSGCAGLYSSIAVDNNDNVHISYYDRQNESDGNLNYAYKSRSSGNPSWQIDVVDQVGDVGLDTSLALDNFGVPHIAYYDGINKRLKYAVIQTSYSGLVGNVGCAWDSPDCNVCSRDVVNTFNSLDVNGDILGFNLAGTPDPTWNDYWEWHHHWQGVQRIMPGDGQYMVVSLDSANPSESIFTTVRLLSRNDEGLRYRSNVLSSSDFAHTYPQPDNDYAVGYELISTVNTHPGGIQAMGDYLAVGTGPEVKIYNLHTPFNPQPVGEVIDRGEKSGSTTALAQLWDGTFLLVVSDSDAKSLDFYKSTGTTLRYWENSFDEWTPTPTELIWDRNRFFYGWDTFQSINLVTDCASGKLYLIGTSNLDKTADCPFIEFGVPCIPNGQDWASLYEISEQSNEITIKKVAERHFICSHRGKTYCNFDAAAGVFVDANHQLYLYSTEHGSNGASNSVKFKEFRPLPEASCTGLADSWVKLYGSNSTIMIDFRDYTIRDYSDFKEVEDFTDQAYFATWCIAQDYSFFVYEHDSFGGEPLGLRGTGGLRYGWLISSWNELEASSGRFLWDPAHRARLDPGGSATIEYVIPQNAAATQENEPVTAPLDTRSISIYVPPLAVTQTMTMTLTPQSPPTQDATPLGFSGYGFNLDITDADIVRESFEFSTPVDVTIVVEDGDFAGLNHATVGLYFWDGTAEQWVAAGTTCSSGHSPAAAPNTETFVSSVCKLGEYALLGELIPTSVLVDEAHDNLLTLGWTRAQQISASIPGSDPDWFYLADLETSLDDEFSFAPVTGPPLTSSFLENYDVLMVPNYQGSMSVDEVNAIRSYVERGGGLVLIGDCAYGIPNPELPASYGSTFDEHCLFGPAPDFNGDIVITRTLGHAATGDTGTISLNWPQSLVISGLAAPISVSREDTWRDDDWSNSYEAGSDTIGDFDIGSIYETGCGRVVTLGDNAFSNSSLAWTDNEIYMRNLLRWVSSGQNCTLSADLEPARILLDEGHNNQLSIDWTRAQELADEWGLSSYPEFAHMGALQDILSAEFSMDRHTGPAITSQLLAAYDALMVPLYHDPYSMDEIQAVRDFVSSGGGLILFGDSGWSIPNPELISRYGIEILPIGLHSPTPDLIADFTVIPNANHPAVTGKLDYELDYSEAVELSGSALSMAGTFFNEAWADQDWDDVYDPGEEGVWEVAAASESGCGRVAVLADNSISDYDMETSNNQAFIRSILRWLTEARTCSYDVHLPMTLKE